LNEPLNEGCREDAIQDSNKDRGRDHCLVCLESGFVKVSNGRPGDGQIPLCRRITSVVCKILAYSSGDQHVAHVPWMAHRDPKCGTKI